MTGHERTTTKQRRLWVVRESYGYFGDEPRTITWLCSFCAERGEAVNVKEGHEAAGLHWGATHGR